MLLDVKRPFTGSAYSFNIAYLAHRSLQFAKKQAYFVENVEATGIRSFDQTRALCTTYTSYGTYMTDGNVWPNNTVPNIAQRANATLSLSVRVCDGYHATA